MDTREIDVSNVKRSFFEQKMLVFFIYTLMSDYCVNQILNTLQHNERLSLLVSTSFYGFGLKLKNINLSILHFYSHFEHVL